MIAKFIRSLAKQETVIDAFDEKLFVAVIEHVTMSQGDCMMFYFIGGLVIS